MTLTRTLRVEQRYLQYDDLRAMAYCEKRCEEEGRSLKRWELVNFIEKMLRELHQNGIDYPKVLLLRKKEIQRQTSLQSSERTKERRRKPARCARTRAGSP